MLVWPHRWGALLCWELCCVGVAPLVGCSPLLGAVLCWCGPTQVGCSPLLGAVLCWCGPTVGVLSFVGSCAVLVWPSR